VYPNGYICGMNTILQTDDFRAWLGELKDLRAKAIIFNRLDRATKGNFGDSKALGGGVSEMRIDSGPGYRIYYTRRGEVVYLLLVGGDKSNQSIEVQRSRALLKSLPKEQP
jgi:putative addiction module killer protein